MSTASLWSPLAVQQRPYNEGDYTSTIPENGIGNDRPICIKHWWFILLETSFKVAAHTPDPTSSAEESKGPIPALRFQEHVPEARTPRNSGHAPCPNRIPLIR